MKAKILSNKKLIVYIGIAVALFAAVNIAWWINANASQSDNSKAAQSEDVTVYKGRHIEGDTEGGDKYEFIQGVNMPDFYLDADHDPSFPSSGAWYGICFREDRCIAWNKNKNHPWSQAEFWYGGRGEEGDSSYKFSNLEFIESNFLSGQSEKGSGYLGIHYSKDTPLTTAAQGMEVFFKLDCYDENGNYLGTKRTHDGFKEEFSNQGNRDVLERAGHVKERGDYFQDALDLVGYKTLFFALKEGRIKISIERLVMEQDD